MGLTGVLPLWPASADLTLYVRQARTLTLRMAKTKTVKTPDKDGLMVAQKVTRTARMQKV